MGKSFMNRATLPSYANKLLDTHKIFLKSILQVWLLLIITIVGEKNRVYLLINTVAEVGLDMRNMRIQKKNQFEFLNMLLIIVNFDTYYSGN